MQDRLIIEKTKTIWIAQFNNPPYGDMDHHTAEALAGFLDEVEADEQVRAVILTGSKDDVFIRHYDVSVLLERGRAMADRGLQFSLDRLIPESQLHQSLKRMETLPIPFIAAINGTAMGGGFEMALACDFRLVKQGDYDLGLPEINIGLLAGAGGTQRLPRLIGQAKALEMELLGRTIVPAEAVALGVAMEIVEGDVLARAVEIAEKLVSKNSQAVAHIKQLVRGSAQWNIDEGLAKERTLFCDLMVSEESLNAMSNFVETSADIRDID